MKPATLPLIMDGVPSALRALPWIGWRWGLRPDGGWKKEPFQIGHPGAKASNSTLTHWRNEGDVREVQIMAPDLFDGFGIVVTPAAGMTFIDLDDVRDADTGVIEAWALAMVDKFDSWAELSVSGTGLHIFCFGQLPGAGRVDYLDGDSTRKVEAYSTGRFAFLTGHALDPVRPWVARLIEDLKRRAVRLLVLDAARRLSAKTDEGPAKVRELIAVLRTIVTLAAVTIIIVHHDIKPPTTGQDLRRRSQRASGGDWFAGCECPVHIERVNESDSLVYPQDYKFSADAAPFTFRCRVEDRLIVELIGADTSIEGAETVGARGKLLDWLRVHGPASKTAMKKAGFGWETLTALLDG